jgi:probable rRNA maturation factor
MMFTVEIHNDAGYVVDEPRLQAAAVTVLTQQDAPWNSALTIVIADDESVAALNRQYRGLDSRTDVLSFPADAPPIPLIDEPPYLGDVIIAYPYATAQAKRLGHDVGDSLALLVVHGALHLLGYNHDTLENRIAMWAAQETAIRALHISPQIVPALESYEHQA